MKDYLVHANDHAIEITCVSFAQARSEAASLKSLGHEDVTIDQYIEYELSGVYWTYGKYDLANRLIKHA